MCLVLHQVYEIDTVAVLFGDAFLVAETRKY
jgi:hypothetical protein